MKSAQPETVYTISKEDLLLRRFPKKDEPKWLAFWKIIDGKKIPTSAAFKTKPDEDGLSVNILALTTPELSKGDSETFGVASFSASIPLDANYECRHDPQPGNDAHALIMGDTHKIAKKLSKNIIEIY